MSFDAFDLALDLIRSLRDPMTRIASRDSDLEKQLRRAASSIALNLGEARRRFGRHQEVHHPRLARRAERDDPEDRRAVLPGGAGGHARGSPCRLEPRQRLDPQAALAAPLSLGNVDVRSRSAIWVDLGHRSCVADPEACSAPDKTPAGSLLGALAADEAAGVATGT